MGLTLTSAKSLEPAKPVTKKSFGRQCCSKLYDLGDGNYVTLTACAGWFLSDDANAMERACAKVDEAAEVLN